MVAGFVHMVKRCAVNTPLRCMLLAFEFKKNLQGEMVVAEFDSEPEDDDDVYSAPGKTPSKKKAKKIEKTDLTNFIDDVEKTINGLLKGNPGLTSALVSGLGYPGLPRISTKTTKQVQTVPFEFRESDVEAWAATIQNEGFKVNSLHELKNFVLLNEQTCKFYFAKHHAASKHGIVKLEQFLTSLVDTDFSYMIDFKTGAPPMAFMCIILEIPKQRDQMIIMNTFIRKNVAQSKACVEDFMEKCIKKQRLDLVLKFVGKLPQKYCLIMSASARHFNLFVLYAG